MNIYAPLGTKKQSGPIRDLNPFKLSNCAIMEYFLHDSIWIAYHFSAGICANNSHFSKYISSIYNKFILTWFYFEIMVVTISSDDRI